MNSTNKPSLYDSNDYYSDDNTASRLSSIFNGIIWQLDNLRARFLTRVLLQFAPELRLRLKSNAVSLQAVPPVNALDVGAGNGSFLFFLARLGFSVFGTTASQRAQQGALKNFKLNLEFTTELAAPITNQKYDLVVYWHVYEHLSDVNSHAQKWKNMLTDDGLLVLEVPNINSWGAKICYSSWLGSDDVHHINHQTPTEILKTLADNGLKPVKTTGFSLKFSYVFLWSALLGKFFGSHYSFDNIMDILKNPVSNLRRQPLVTINAALSLAYLFPVILFYIIKGFSNHQGEVFRVYAQKV